ncbi:MmgE/PrpD family protein [Henriciella sp. AS95]|uniref:MmgE/PrpD family protein n=1 Tax=Henriciella sp. AS95 TaxID=3135782 RepID=UPI00318088F0
MNAADRLVAHALSIAWADLPAESCAAAKTFLHDTLAVGAAGRNEPLADTVFTVAQGWSGEGGTSLVLGRPGVRLPAPSAAFVNAYQVHSQEYDCVHEPAVAHPMATVGAALLAEAGRSAPVSGERFLEAVVAGVEIVASLGVAVKGSLKFFRPATAGIFGSVAALARMRELSPDVARTAFGHALAFASGTMQAHVEGKPTLAIQVAGAARSAIIAIDLAAAGFPAPEGSIDGPYGYFALFEDNVELEPVLDGLGDRQRIQELSWKPFPTGRAAHGAIVAMQTLMTEEGISEHNLKRFVYRAPPLIERLVGRRPVPDMSINYARLCFAWLGANVLRSGTVSLADFTTENLSDPGLMALAEKISVECDGTDDWSAFAPATGRAELNDGRIVETEVMRQFGAPEWPLTEQQHLQKAQACMTFGGCGAEADSLAALMTIFEGLDDVHQSLAQIFDAGC